MRKQIVLKKEVGQKIVKHSKKVLKTLLGARTPEGIFTEIFASLGDKAPPPFTISEGWPPTYSGTGGLKPERETYNFLYNQLYALGYDINRMGGALVWDTNITYDQYAVVAGSDGNLYIAVISQAGNDPVGDGGTNWSQVPSRAEIEGYIALLQGNNGASQIGTTSGNTVQQELDGLVPPENLIQASCRKIGTLNDVQFPTLFTAIKGVSNVTNTGTTLNPSYRIFFSVILPNVNDYLPLAFSMSSEHNILHSGELNTTYIDLAADDAVGGLQPANWSFVLLKVNNL